MPTSVVDVPLAGVALAVAATATMLPAGLNATGPAAACPRESHLQPGTENEWAEVWSGGLRCARPHLHWSKMLLIMQGKQEMPDALESPHVMDGVRNERE